MSIPVPTPIITATDTIIAVGDDQRLTGGGEGMVNMDSPLTIA